MLVLDAAGTCSFCGTDAADAGSLATRTGRSCRICSQCTASSLDLFVDMRDADAERSAAPATPRTAAERDAFIASLEDLGVDPRVVAAQRGTLDQQGYQGLIAEWVCSLCDAPPGRPYNLIPSAVTPRTHICTSCLDEARSLYGSLGSATE